MAADAPALPPARRLVPWAGASLAAGVAAYGAATRAAGPHRGDGAFTLRRAVAVNRPVEELYAFWRDPSSVARFSTRVRSLEEAGHGRVRWRAGGPGDREASGEVELDAEEEPQLVRWRSAGERSGDYRVEVRMTPGHADRGVEVTVELAVEPPAAAALRALGEWPDRQLTEELRRFKQLIETGEVATTEGQPAGRRSPLGRALARTALGRPTP